ncbi:MAG: DUF4342 domain-containing protein [Chloroflexota bacterium]
MDDTQIPIEEDFEEMKDNANEWTEQVSVAGGQLVETIQALLREAVVRKITVVDKDGKTLIEIPLYAGILGVALLGYWSVLALIAAWFTEVSIRIVREGTPEDLSDEEPVVSGASIADMAERAGKGFSEAMAKASKAASDMAAKAADSLESYDNGHIAEKSPEDVVNTEPARCQATTKSGTQCKRNAMPGSEFCSTHQPA